MLTVNGVIGTWAGPDEPGTAYVMLHHSIGDVGDGHLGSWGFQQGGMGARLAIRSAARPSRSAAEIRTNAQGEEDPRAAAARPVGVALENGDELRAPIGRHAASTRRSAFLDLIDRHELPGGLRARHRAVEDALGRREDQRRASPSCRTSPPTPGKDQQDAPHRVGRAVLLARSTRSARSRTRTWSARAPTRRSWTARSRPRWTRSSRPRACTCSRCSASGCPTTGTRSRTARSSRPTRTGSSTATTSSRPNFKGAVIDRQVIGPYDMEQELGLIGGNIFHGELSRRSAVPHAPGARATRTTARRSRACTTARAPRTAAAA